MSPRLALELTSERADGTWTWRAAGARQPKGVLDGKLLPPGAGVGDVVRAEAEIDIEGITVTTVLPPKGGRREPERIEILGSGREEPAVTSTLTGRGDRGGERSPRGERPARPRRGEGPTGRRDGPGRPSGDRPSRAGAPGQAHERTRRERPARPPRPELPTRPKPKKLRPARVHRDALMAELPPEQHPIAELVHRAGMPGVRAALDEQRATARAQGKPEVPVAAVMAIAEGLLPRLRVAEWLDRADAAVADAEELALADLRSVVVSADDVARDEQTRAPAAKLRAVLERRTEVEQREWRADLEQSMAAGRVVRALRLSSRAPQPGERLPAEAATTLAEAASAAMTTEITPDRWATLLDAVAYSAVRRSVTPAGLPAEPGDELVAQVRKHARRVPAIAALFGIEAPEPATRGGRGRRSPTEAGRRPPTAPAAGLDPPGDARPRPRRIPPPPVVPTPEEAVPPSREEAVSDTATPDAAGVDVASSEPAAATPPEPGEAVDAEQVVEAGPAVATEPQPQAPSPQST